MNYNGLSNEEVIISRKKYGTNEIIIHKKNQFISLLLSSFSDPIIRILLIALAIKVLFLFSDSDIYEIVGILLAIILSASISSLSEYGSEKAFEKLLEENSKTKVNILRNNKEKMLWIDDIVVGDVLLLHEGEKVPADCKIIDGILSLNESALTGESEEKVRKANDYIYRGSIITEGVSTVVVLAVGHNTKFGILSKNIEEKAPISPLTIRLKKLAKIISGIAYAGAFLVIISYLFNVIFLKNNFESDKIYSFFANKDIFLPQLLYALTLGVTIIVVSVPEGLPMMITLVLSSNMKRMLKSNVLVRKMVGIETAGSLNTLFVDKTGTITEGIFKIDKLMDSKLNIVSSLKEIEKDTKEKMEICLFYNTTTVIKDNEVLYGNSTEKAIKLFVKDLSFNYKVLNRTKFKSENKYSSCTVNYDNKTVFYQGAYEIILDKCRYISNKKEIENKLLEETKKGYRVLALAYSKNEEAVNMNLIGFLFLKDKPRKSANNAVKSIKEAGVNIIMVTGDSPSTATSVARETGILSSGNDIIITSSELNKLNDEEIKKIFPYIKVISRSFPHDKIRLVRIAQELGLVTGMTGDGINDAPALKKSDVGFAMGSGTEIAKEVSDIIILDDNISSIASTILYGRTIFKSIRKFIIFQLTINFIALFLSIVGPLIGIASPITIIQMLWINMVMDTLAALAFSYEVPKKEYMREKPKAKEEPIMNSYMVNQIICSGLYSSLLCIYFLKSPFIYSIFRIDSSDKYLYTAFFGLFIFLSIFNMFNARTHRINILSSLFKNKVFILVTLFIVIVQIILIYYGGALFRTTGLTLCEFEIMIILSFSIIPLDMLRKIYLRLINRKHGV